MPFWRVMKFLCGLSVSLTLLSPAQIHAQSKPSSGSGLVGKTFTPSERMVLYSSPESGLISRQHAKVLVTPSNGSVAVYPLTSQGADYVTGAPTFAAEGLTIQHYRDVVQGRSVTKWLMVSGAGHTGWIKYDPMTIDPILNTSR
ncbi:MAG: hypothetical protein ABJL99_06990 [Aliishimia sp.]